MSDRAELESALRELIEGGALDLLEDGERWPDTTSLQFELHEKPHGLFLHLWTSDRNLTRRVLRTEHAETGHLRLEVQRFGSARPGRIEFLAREFARTPQRVSRDLFGSRLRELLRRHFPDDDVEELTAAADMRRSLSGSYARGLVRHGAAASAVLGVPPQEDAGTVDGALTYGLIWLAHAREKNKRGTVEELRLVLPEGAAAATAHRMKALGERARVQVWCPDESLQRLRRVELSEAGNVDSWLTPHRDTERLLTAARSVVEEMRALALDAIDVNVRFSSSLHPLEIVFRFRGLEFARWTPDGLDACEWNSAGDAAWFRASGAGDARLRATVTILAEHRHPLAEDKNHPLFRRSAERWLESLLLGDVAQLDARLLREHVYRQVPAVAGSGAGVGAGRGILDLLGITRDGRLVVIELKAREEIHLPLQGADYWLRVHWHQRNRDFQRMGYFAGVEISPQPPLLYLVAPGLEFHPATETLLRFLSPEIEVHRIGLNQDWRSGARVVFRKEGIG